MAFEKERRYEVSAIKINGDRVTIERRTGTEIEPGRIDRAVYKERQYKPHWRTFYRLCKLIEKTVNSSYNHERPLFHAFPGGFEVEW